MKTNYAIKTSELEIVESQPEMLTTTYFESLGSFKMYKLLEMVREDNSKSLFTAESENLHIIFYQEEFDTLVPIDIKNDHHGIFKIFIGSQRQTKMQELNEQNVSGYCCILDENFFSLFENPSNPLPIFTSLKHANECIINISPIKLERFNLIFDLIYTLSKSSVRHKAILIASYLLVILREADFIFKESIKPTNPTGKRPQIMQRHFRKVK